MVSPSPCFTGVHALLAGTLLVSGTLAQATLGEKAGSITQDSVRMTALVSTTPQSLYTDHVLTQASGLTIHEFSRSDGTIFAVAWAGPVMPDLQQLLGSYFAQFVSTREQADQHVGLSRFHAATEGLVIHSSGRLGAFTGMVYDPSLMPVGVTPGQLQ